MIQCFEIVLPNSYKSKRYGPIAQGVKPDAFKGLVRSSSRTDICSAQHWRLHFQTSRPETLRRRYFIWMFSYVDETLLGHLRMRTTTIVVMWGRKSYLQRIWILNFIFSVVCWIRSIFLDETATTMMSSSFVAYPMYVVLLKTSKVKWELIINKGYTFTGFIHV